MCVEQFAFSECDLNPRFLFSCMLERSQAEASSHSHDFIELAVIMQGSGEFVINGETFFVQEGDLILLNPGTYHQSLLVSAPKRKTLECYLSFSNISYRNCPKNFLPLFPGNRMIFHMPDGMRKEVFRIVNAIEGEIRKYKAGQYFMLKAYLIELLCTLARECTEKEDTKETYRRFQFQSPNKKYVVSQIQAFLQEHYREKISLEQIAANMYLSSYYISKIFKSETGDSPINYLIGLRMEKAREILEERPGTSIQEAAAQVGYDDVYHFSKLFKKYYGISPVYYKARNSLKGQ